MIYIYLYTLCAYVGTFWWPLLLLHCWAAPLSEDFVLFQSWSVWHLHVQQQPTSHCNIQNRTFQNQATEVWPKSVWALWWILRHSPTPCNHGNVILIVFEATGTSKQPLRSNWPQISLPFLTVFAPNETNGVHHFLVLTRAVIEWSTRRVSVQFWQKLFQFG